MSRVRGEVHTGLWWGNLKVPECLECLAVDGRMILKRILKEFLVWINLAENRDNWQAGVNTVMNIRVSLS